MIASLHLVPTRYLVISRSTRSSRVRVSRISTLFPSTTCLSCRHGGRIYSPRTRRRARRPLLSSSVRSSIYNQDRTDGTVGDDTGAFGAAAGLVFDAHDFLGGPRLQRGAIVIDNGKVVSVVVEKTPPEGECLDLFVGCIADSSHRLLRRAGPHYRLDYHN